MFMGGGSWKFCLAVGKSGLFITGLEIWGGGGKENVGNNRRVSCSSSYSSYGTYSN